MQNKIILLIDMDAYFASVEQLCNPRLKGKAVAVCGDGRTVITTASYEARKYGVKTGMTVYQAKKMCPGIIIVKGDLNKYIDTSLSIHKILLDFTEKVEVFSIDECFLDITDSYLLFGSALDVGKKIKQRIKSEIGLNCSIGIGPTKTVAKLAAKMSKPDGLLEIKKEDVEKFLKNLPLEKLQGVGIGEKTAEKLKMLGIKTAGELGNASEMLLKAHFGINGHILKRIGQGLYDSPVKSYLANEIIKSVGHSHTLPEDTDDIKVIKSYLLMLCEKVAKRMRKYRVAGKTITLILRYSNFKTFMKRCTLKYYTSESYEIFKNAFEIFEKNFGLKNKIRMLGVSVSNLITDDGFQYLLDTFQKKKKFTEVKDKINDRYGEWTLKPASLIIAEKFGIVKKCAMIGARQIKKCEEKI